ncbi:epoxide hydrolase family protein [Pseudonocardia humida]|uniref:Epoxide hydrolase N-terminal domain-containing protein n=1 Tax=Pseudonocardia humida TaxID=2800819 RepID=A0ABT1ADF3_9PSEU|nr:epoxide hydrolase N-terminal domain-containing protein [Pseudonocardia humida]MCO1660619.1 epoxide hydrolase N-terminal domain-containing protein [Pseudonocardia humida]
MGTDTDITPFTLDTPQAELDDLADRLARTRWPRELPGVGWERGIPVGYLRELARYWSDGFDWRAQERRINAFDQFTTEVDGQSIHFLHVRSPEPDALPLLVSHGWPSSVVEFLEVIGPLTDPRAHGADPSTAFHLVVPSLPGFAFSPPVRETGWGLPRTVDAYAELMRRLGYDRYGTQGGDIGGGVAGMLAAAAPKVGGQVVGIHMNGPSSFAPLPEGVELTDAERVRAERDAEFERTGSGYLALQANQPSTIGVALNDSPVGQLAWIAEKFRAWTDPAKSTPDEAVDRDLLLTNVTATWLSGAGAGSAHFVYESMHGPLAWAAPDAAGAAPEGSWSGPSVPTGIAVFAGDNSIRARFDDGSVTRWTEYDRGGHFAALEVPDLLVHDVREFFATVR